MIKAAELPFKKPGNIRSVYDAAATTQAQDYDDIMKGYDSVLNTAKSNQNNKLNYVPLNPIVNKYLPTSSYSRSQGLNSAVSGLEEFGKTGGYSDTDIENIRARSISPIKSIYSSAQEGLRRNKVLQGGYAPNYGAVSAKMARESAGQIGDITTKVNADIAQMIASGKFNALSNLAPIMSRENELINSTNQRNDEMRRAVELENAEEERRVETLNNENKLKTEVLNNQNTNENVDTELRALGGKQSLYGTTPALTQTFANQVLQNNAQNMQASQTANMIKNQRANVGLNLAQGLGIPRAGARG